MRTIQQSQGQQQMPYKIALVQFNPVRKDIEANIVKIQGLLEGITADLIVLPELSNTGYLYENSKELIRFSEPSNGTGKFLQSLVSFSTSTKGIIIAGYSELEGERLFNSAAAVSPDGVIMNYRKTHLYADEKLLFDPGDTGFKVLEWMGVKIGMMICFDWIFPEAARTLAINGAQIIAHPANLVMPYCQNAMITRSIENKVFTITANRIGQERLHHTRLQFTGASQITSPTGTILYRGPQNKETIHITTIEPEQSLNKMISAKNHVIDDRRPEFYQS